MDIHSDIKEKLDEFVRTQKVPHLLFHGPSGSGKKTLVSYLLHSLYGSEIMNDPKKVKEVLMQSSCLNGKGIKFVREGLKDFAKKISSVPINHKTIVLYNADNLTADAQSALRRCIEIFSMHNRFIIVVENSSTLMRPILSRLCEIYVPRPNNWMNLYTLSVEPKNRITTIDKTRLKQLNDILEKITERPELIPAYCEKLYSESWCALDIFEMYKQTAILDNTFSEQDKKYEFLYSFDIIRKEIRNEMILMAYLLDRNANKLSLENISLM